LIVKYNVDVWLEEHEIDYLWLHDGEICCCLAIAMCWSVWHYRTWSRWHLWFPILHGGRNYFDWFAMLKSHMVMISYICTCMCL